MKEDKKLAEAKAKLLGFVIPLVQCLSEDDSKSSSAFEGKRDDNEDSSHSSNFDEKEQDSKSSSESSHRSKVASIDMEPEVDKDIVSVKSDVLAE